MPAYAKSYTLESVRLENPSEPGVPGTSCASSFPAVVSVTGPTVATSQVARHRSRREIGKYQIARSVGIPAMMSGPIMKTAPRDAANASGAPPTPSGWPDPDQNAATPRVNKAAGHRHFRRTRSVISRRMGQAFPSAIKSSSSVTGASATSVTPSARSQSSDARWRSSSTRQRWPSRRCTNTPG